MKTIKIGAKPTGRDAKSIEEWVDGDLASQAASEPLKRLTIEVPLSLHQKVKLKCVTDGTSMADLVRGPAWSICG